VRVGLLRVGMVEGVLGYGGVRFFLVALWGYGVVVGGCMDLRLRVVFGL